MVKLFLADIDGCLAAPYEAYDLDGFRALADYGRRAETDERLPRLGICSGRSYAYVEAVAQALDLRGPALFESGGGRFDLAEARIRWSEHLTPDVERQLGEVRAYFHREIMPNTGFAYDYGKRAQSGVVWTDEAEVERWAEVVDRWVDGRYPDLAVHPTHVSIDVVPRALTKRVAVETVAAEEGLTMDELAFIGDTGGDLAAPGGGRVLVRPAERPAEGEGGGGHRDGRPGAGRRAGGVPVVRPAQRSRARVGLSRPSSQVILEGAEASLYSGPLSVAAAAMFRLPLLTTLLFAAPLVWAQRAPGTSGSRSATPAPPVETVAEEAEPRRAESDAPLFYVVGERPRVHAAPDARRTIGRLDFREGVHVLETRDGWSRIFYEGQSGWVASESLSNVWLMVDKANRHLFVYRGTDLVRTLPIDVSQNPEDDKVRRATLGEKDHYRIPEGVFYVCRKNPNSQYYRSFVLNYPNEEDAERGFKAGLISRAEYRQIVRASLGFLEPPMSTALGGGIAIHGQGSGRQRAWTRGCVALRDVHLDALWDLVEVGTPVLVQ